MIKKVTYVLGAGASFNSTILDWTTGILIFVIAFTPSCNKFKSNCEIVETYENGSNKWVVCYDSSPQSETYYKFARNSDTLTIAKHNILDSNKIYLDFIKLYEENQLYHAIYYDQKDTSKRYEYYLNKKMKHKDYDYKIGGHPYYTKRTDINDSLIGVHISPNFELVDQDLFDNDIVFKIILPIPDSLKLYQGVMLKYRIYHDEYELCADSMRITSNNVGQFQLRCDPEDFRDLYSLNDTTKLELRTEIKTKIYHHFTSTEFMSILK